MLDNAQSISVFWSTSGIKRLRQSPQFCQSIDAIMACDMWQIMWPIMLLGLCTYEYVHTLCIMRALWYNNSLVSACTSEDKRFR